MLNIQRVLYPTDFSEGSKRAFPQAAYFAHWHEAELHVLNVTGRHEHTYDEAKANFPLSSETMSEWLGSPSHPEPESGWPDLETMAVVQEQIESANPSERLVDYAEEHDIDLVVMGTHGRRGVERLLIGSVTEEVVRAAPCPVLTIRSTTEARPDRAVRRILVPVDFSEASEDAIMHAKEIALTYGAEIDLIHVVEEAVYPSAYGVEPVSIPTQEIIDRVEDNLGELVREDIGYEHAMVKAVVGYAPRAILDHAEENDIDLIVIATHGRTGLDRILLGSVTERVLRQSPTPVFVVKPGRKSLLPKTAQKASSAE
jgi:nucleotide-binding universal stress UspA family protein